MWRCRRCRPGSPRWAQWYELTWGNVVDTRTQLHDLCNGAGLQVTEETTFSRFSILVAIKV
jgi:hypothetical protein